jgi:DNA-binding MarR family transcriptional regulator
MSEEIKNDDINSADTNDTSVNAAANGGPADDDAANSAPANADAASDAAKAVFTQFGHVAIHRSFMYFAAMNALPDDWHRHQRGPRRVFAVLAERGDEGMTNAELAEELDVRPSSVTALVDRLEQEGLVRRDSSPTDRRVTLIRLTETGKERVTERGIERGKMMDAALASFSQEERQQLGNLLRKAADNLDAAFPEDLKPGMWGRGRGFGDSGFPQHPDPFGRGWGRDRDRDMDRGGARGRGGRRGRGRGSRDFGEDGE